VEIVEVEETTANHERGAGGFGSTGRTTHAGSVSAEPDGLTLLS
jgi:hypothetical protein